MNKKLEDKQEKKLNKKTRDSNIELLRIIAMLLIIIHHIVIHTNIYLYIGENHFASLVLLTGGKIAVIIYILIMGYYSKKSKFNISRPINIIIKVVVYSILFMIIFNKNNFLNIKEYKQYWFINTWLILFMLEPIIKICEREIPTKIQKMIFMWITIFFLVPIRRISDIEAFIYIYLCGRHILPKFVKIFDKQILNIFAIIVLYLALIAFNLGLRPYTTIIPLVTSMIIFTLFANLKIKSNIINEIAKHTIGVYLIHDNQYVRNRIIAKKLNIVNIFYTQYFLIGTIGISIIIFIICTILDYIVSKIIENSVFKIKKLNEIILKINNKVNKYIDNNGDKNEKEKDFINNIYIYNSAFNDNNKTNKRLRRNMEL